MHRHQRFISLLKKFKKSEQTTADPIIKFEVNADLQREYLIDKNAYLESVKVFYRLFQQLLCCNKFTQVVLDTNQVER